MKLTVSIILALIIASAGFVGVCYVIYEIMLFLACVMMDLGNLIW
ncbi:hypothetical protein CC31p272 [Enterobacter phage CC31]|uniref:Uncharacterized protein n=1 Tax=Enterobacter phage CC31 TaxID=709484 RepID=E5DI04_9CAUD|nr:hypothetical protein CC31p272 [Enterobacter phage CC31]ADB81768.1 hypothetical protein CC31p272 [Enterobacter phage CC31]